MRVHALLLQPRQTAQQQLPPADIGLHTFARHGAHVQHRFKAQALGFGRGRNRQRQRVFAAALHTGGQSQRLLVVLARCRQLRRNTRLPHGEGACFVKGHGLHSVRHLQRLRVFDQDAVFGRHASARHDGHGGGQTQRTRTGNHQHGHRVDQRSLKMCASPKPPQQRQQRQQQHHGHKHFGHLVHQALNGRFGRLRVFNQTNDV